MAPDSGNAVDAKWVGPGGHQLFDGTILEPGTIVQAIGKDEVEASPYWEQVRVKASDHVAGSASELRDDWSFHTEEGGGSTGRPELEPVTSAVPELESAPVVDPSTEVAE